jgi:hypothetical protein
MFNVVMFPHVRAVRPELYADTFAGFYARLQHAERTEKGGALYSCVKYAPGAKRGNAGVVEISALVADLDGKQIASSNLHLYNHVAYTTWSHRDDDPHWHVVVPFTQAVPVEHWGGVWREVHERLGLEGDEQTKDPARMFYLPQHAAGQPYELRRGGTIWFDPSIIDATGPYRQWSTSSPRTRRRVSQNAVYAKYFTKGWWEQPVDLSMYEGLTREEKIEVMRQRWAELKARNGWLTSN